MTLDTEKTPMIGIVTVLFNSDDVLPGFFSSLASQLGISYHLYVIDNSKSDSGSRLSAELAEKYGIKATIVFNNENKGVAEGNNQGIELALKEGCEYVLLANNDIEFDNPHLISSLRSQITERNLAAITPKIYYYGHEKRIWYAGGKFSVFRATAYHFGDEELDQGQYDSLDLIEYAPTCFVLIKREVFDKIGIMDPKYFVYFDDTDFMWRMHRAGLPLGFAPHEIIQHKVSFSTGGSLSNFSIYYGTRNRCFYIKKHYGFLQKIASFGFFFASRAIKLALYTPDQRKALLTGLRDGLKQ